MKHKKLLIGVLAIALLVGAVSAATILWFGQVKMTATVSQAVLVDGKSYPDVIDETVTVAGGESFCKPHYLESQTSVPVELQFDSLKDDAITVTYCKNKLKFDIEEDEETFLLVFIDTREGGAIYDYGDTGSWRRADYMICDPAAATPEWGWYLGKWLREEEDGYEGWSQPYDDIRTWNCEGFGAEESRADGVTHYEFTIPLECIEYDPEYGLYVLIQTGTTGFGSWSDYEIEITSPFTLQPMERLDFYICYGFAEDIEAGTYTITSTVNLAP